MSKKHAAKTVTANSKKILRIKNIPTPMSMFQKATQKIKQQRLEAITFLLLTVFAFFLLLFTTHSSPLFAFNQWVDVNTHYTIGKGLFNGYVHLTDLIDNKGPAVHFIYGLAWLIDRTGHTGVYTFQSIFLAVSLIHVYKLAGLFIERLDICFLIAIISPLPLLAHGNIGNTGGSIEEFVLSIFTVSLYYFAVYFMKPEIHKHRHVILLGGLFATVFLMKFNLAVFFIGFIFAIFYEMLADKKFKVLTKYSLYFFCGVLIISLPYFIYTLANNSFQNFIDVYFLLSNAYTPTANLPVGIRLLNGFSNSINSFNGSPFLLAFMIIGLIFVFLRTKAWLALGYTLSLILLMIFIFIGHIFEYSNIPLIVFLFMGLIALGVLLEKISVMKIFSKMEKYVAVFIIFVLIIGRNGLIRGNLFLSQVIPVQERMAEIIKSYASNESPSLLQTSYQDSGFYTAVGVVPQERYFSVLNISHDVLPEMRDTQRDSVREGRNEFVIIPTGGFEEYPDEGHWQLSNHYVHITVLRDGGTFWHLYQRQDENINMPDYFSHYITHMQNENLILIFSVKDEASSSLNNSMQQALYKIGLNETLQEKYRHSYAAVIDGYDVMYENISTDKIEYAQDIDGTEIQLISAGYEVGNASSVIIDDEEYSLNLRGINIVVYDKSKRKVVDAVSFDTFYLPNIPQR